LPKQIDGRGAEHQELAVAASFASIAVDQPPKLLEQLRLALDLIEDDELVGMAR
jgi:hypothetical protein